MSARPCGGCARPVADAYLCTDCTDRVVGLLYRVRPLADDLETSLCRLARIGSGPEVRAPGAETPLAFNWTASEALWQLHHAVHGWATTLAQANGLTLDGGEDYRLTDPKDPARVFPARSATERAAAWLAVHPDLIRAHPDAADLLDEIDYAVGAGLRSVDLPPERAYAGPCWEDIDDPDDPQGLPMQCTGSLYAPPRAATVVCPECGTEHDMATRRAWLLRMAEDQMVTAVLASRALQGLLGREITASMIRGLAHRGRLRSEAAPDGTPRDAQGRLPTLYRLGDVVDALLESERARKERSRAI